MDNPGIALLVLLAAFVLIAVPIFAIAAFLRTQKLERTVSSEIPRILRRVYALEQKITALEQAIANLSGATAPPQKRIETAIQKPAPSVQPERPISVPVTPAEAPSPLPTGHVPPAAIPARPALRPSAAEPQAARSGSGLSLEAVVAGRWLNHVGILALLFAVAFFLKYAFENDWIGARGRIEIGLLIGAALFSWSQRLLDRGYRYFSEGIAGLGAAILYLSLWAGWHYYHIIPQNAAFALMIVVTAAATTVAVGRNSERIALLALIGGVITPLLVSTGQNQEIVLFSYLAVLGVGMLAVARLRDWKTLPPIQFAATLIYFWGWYERFYDPAALARTIFFATLFFVIFAALPVARSRLNGELSILEACIAVANAFAHLIALRVVLWPDHRWALTLAVLALAAVHLLIDRVLPIRPGQLPLARIIFAGLALTYVTLAIPIRLDGKAITIAWAVEGAILIWSGLRIRVPALRIIGLILFGIVTFRLAFIPIPADELLFNARFGTFAACVACAVLACYFVRTPGIDIGEAENSLFMALAIAANVGALSAASLEIWDAFGGGSLGIDRRLAQELALSTFWLVYSLGLIAAGVIKKSAAIRWQALALLGIVIAKVFFFDLSFLERFYRIVSFFLLGIVLMLISFYYQHRVLARQGDRTP